MKLTQRISPSAPSEPKRKKFRTIGQTMKNHSSTANDQKRIRLCTANKNTALFESRWPKHSTFSRHHYRTLVEQTVSAIKSQFYQSPWEFKLCMHEPMCPSVKVRFCMCVGVLYYEGITVSTCTCELVCMHIWMQTPKYKQRPNL